MYHFKSRKNNFYITFWRTYINFSIRKKNKQLSFNIIVEFNAYFSCIPNKEKMLTCNMYNNNDQLYIYVYTYIVAILGSEKNNDSVIIINFLNNNQKYF